MIPVIIIDTFNHTKPPLSLHVVHKPMYHLRLSNSIVPSYLQLCLALFMIQVDSVAYISYLSSGFYRPVTSFQPLSCVSSSLLLLLPSSLLSSSLASLSMSDQLSHTSLASIVLLYIYFVLTRGWLVICSRKNAALPRLR